MDGSLCLPHSGGDPTGPPYLRLIVHEQDNTSLSPAASTGPQLPSTGKPPPLSDASHHQDITPPADGQVPLLSPTIETERTEHWQYWRQRDIPRYVRNGFRSDWQLDVALCDIAEHLACRYWFGSHLPRNSCGLPSPPLRALVELRIRDLFGVLRAVPESELRSALGGLGWHTSYSFVRDSTRHRAAPGGCRPVRLWWPPRPDCAPIVGRVTGQRWHALRRRPLIVWPDLEKDRQQERIVKSGLPIDRWRRLEFVDPASWRVIAEFTGEPVHYLPLGTPPDFVAASREGMQLASTMLAIDYAAV